MRLGAFLLLLAFVLGSCLGNKTASPDTEFVKIRQPTKIVTAEPLPAPPAEVVMPDSCTDALKYARRIATAGTNMYKAGDRQNIIIAEARLAMHKREDLTPIVDKQNDLAGRTVGYLNSLSEWLYHYDVAQKQCKEDMP